MGLSIVLIMMSVVFAFIFRIIAAFFHNIIIFDSLLLAIVGGIFCNLQFNIHPAFCLLIGIAILMIMIFLQVTRIGFWLIGTVFSIFWAGVFGALAYEASNYDPIWGWVIGGLSFIMMIGLHIKSREDNEISDTSYV